MSVLNRKRRIKCKVYLTIQELKSVPIINDILFCKVRLIHGGHFVSYSKKKEITNSCVIWNNEFDFDVNIQKNASNPDFYDPCLCRISVRKEIKGGQKAKKIGYIEYNLCDYINKCETTNRVLKEYDNKNRLDNSFLQVQIRVDIPKAATTNNNNNNNTNTNSNNLTTNNNVNKQSTEIEQPSQQQQQQQIENEQKSDSTTVPPSPPSSITSINSTSNSSTTTTMTTTTTTTTLTTTTTTTNTNNTPTNTNLNDYIINHSRNSSKGSSFSNELKGHQRNVSNSSTNSNGSYEITSTRSKNKKLIEDLQTKETNSQIAATRIDAQQIINEVESVLAQRSKTTNHYHYHHLQQQQQLQQQQDNLNILTSINEFHLNSNHSPLLTQNCYLKATTTTTNNNNNANNNDHHTHSNNIKMSLYKDIELIDS